MSDRATGTWIGRRLVLVPVLALAAVIGLGVGWWLGTMPTTTQGTATTAGPASSEGLPSLSPSTANTEPPPSALILDISASGDSLSVPFKVRSGWQIVWGTDGESFAFTVRGDHDMGTVVEETGSSSGATSIPYSGTFYIEVTARGPWSIKVLQGQR